jgi:type II secretory pathway pseudopilin PulG
VLVAIAIIALVLSAIAFGLSLGNSSRMESHERLHDTQQLIRASSDRCTQSQIKHLQTWIENIERNIKAQEEEK